MLFHLQGIRDYVRGDFNQANIGSFIQEADIDRWANEGYMAYTHRLMLTDQGYFEQTFPLDITAAQEQIALPTIFDGRGKFMKTILLERVLATSRVPLTFHRRYNEANSTNGGLAGFSYLPTWKFRGNNIILEPTPTFTELNAGGTAGLLLTAQIMPPRLYLATALAGSSTTMTFDSSADPRDSYYNGARVYIISGTGAGQINTVLSYVGATRVATFNSSWGVTPNSTSVFSTLMHEDFPEDFHEMIPLYALKCAFGKERDGNSAQSFIITRLKELENQLKDFCDKRTTARKFMQAWHIELF